MGTFVLVVIFHLDGGSSIAFQEFGSLKQCESAKTTIYAERERVKFSGLETAFCVAK